ncbi:class F sortase [Arthrobacter sp. RIT-PI-e]|uniref:class F sortase n=1 Tax=Arthrobacter sp. RIT-PI-e TaxID=1681197 RepID=UPI001F408D5B|nr:class F sortase [Arthrobacter sp. RIT-PI-e]
MTLTLALPGPPTPSPAVGGAAPAVSEAPAVSAPPSSPPTADARPPIAVDTQPPAAAATVPAPSSSPTPTSPPTLDPAPPAVAPETADEAPASQPVGIEFPAAAIDMAVLPLTPSDADLASQQLVPPLTLEAYWLSPYGAPGAGSANTTYIVGHSWEGQDAPFNRLSDETLVDEEFTITTHTGEVTYLVDSVTTHDKDTLKDSDVWSIVPNRVVLISCYTENPWGKNVVVTATPAPQQP